MKWGLILAVAMFVLGNALLLQYKASEDCLIPWQRDRPLTRNDFKARPVSRGAVASTVYSIYRNVAEHEGLRWKAKITTFFLCDESWMIKKWSDDAVLGHEQGHFDLAELFARRLRKKISEISVCSEGEAGLVLDSLYKINQGEMDQWQDEYDNASDHSMDKEGQKKWNLKIKGRLDSLSAYLGTEISFKICGEK